jgi:hypothetical protein
VSETLPRLPQALRAVLVLLIVLPACVADEPTGFGDEPRPPDAFTLASGWVGDYFGSGVGLVDGQPFEAKDATLRIAFDADSVSLATCPACVTLTLDSVFVMENVQVTDPVALDLAYDRAPVRYTLELLRFSANGGLGNAVSARVTIGNAGVPTPFFDVTYLLERP